MNKTIEELKKEILDRQNMLYTNQNNIHKLSSMFRDLSCGLSKI